MKKLLLITFAALFMSAGCTGCMKDETHGETDSILEGQLKAQLASDLAKIGKSMNLTGIKFYFYDDVLKDNSGLRREGITSGDSISIRRQREFMAMYINFVHEIGHARCGFRGRHDDTHPNIMTTTVALDVHVSFYVDNARKYDYLKEWANWCGI